MRSLVAFTALTLFLLFSSAQTAALTGQIIGATQQVTPLIISEFRFSGTNTQDEYVELYNNSDASITVATTDGSAGWALVSNDSGTVNVRGRINNGTVIPARAHYLFASSPFIGGYQLTGYAVPDQAMIPPDISDGAGVALFRTTTPANFTLVNRLDAVGFGNVTDTLYKEGGGLAPSGGIASNTSNYAFVRDLSSGKPKDTDNNAADFRLVSTTGAVIGGVQSTLGAPGPESAASPVDRTSKFPIFPLDSSQGASASPNRERDLTSDPANNSTNGTMTIRHRFTNNMGAAVTRLRFRVVIITGSPVQGSDMADLRVRSSSDTTVGVNDSATCSASALAAPCTVTVRGLTLEAPSAANNGGLNSSLSVAAVTTAPVSFGGDEVSADGFTTSDFGDDAPAAPGPAATGDDITLDAPLANGASLNVQFLFGVQKTGRFRFYVIVEALP